MIDSQGSLMRDGSSTLFELWGPVVVEVSNLSVLKRYDIPVSGDGTN